VLLAFGAACTLTPTAGAQEAATPKLSSACTGFCPGGGPRWPSQFLDKAEYAAGETISINLMLDAECGVLEATSDGFTATAKLTKSPHPTGAIQLYGQATAITTPGTYRATIACTSSPPAVNQFTIKAAPVPPQPSPKPKPTPKPPIVKPKGAADTGGGGTAWVDQR
jgi:hypothetical protein